MTADIVALAFIFAAAARARMPRNPGFRPPKYLHFWQ
jgi:hypothetical protein